jgi:hypothetical protein
VPRGENRLDFSKRSVSPPWSPHCGSDPPADSIRGHSGLRANGTRS